MWSIRTWLNAFLVVSLAGSTFGLGADVRAASPAPEPSPAVAALASPSPALAALASPSPAVSIRPTASGDIEDEVEPTLEQMVGQKLVITMGGHKLRKDLARRIERGEVGGIVLLARNITSPSALRKLTRQLRRATAKGDQPPLLIAVDQEGGSVKRISWAPPTLSAPELGRLGSTRVARAQGARTGSALRRLGINTDLAPVADVPRTSASFMYQQGRTFSFDVKRTARLADAFATGLMSRGVLATMKHFPGIGLSRRNTDFEVSTIRASRTALRADLLPYRRAIRHGLPLIMLSNATYVAYDRRHGAGWSRAIVGELLRDELGFEGVTITDSLNGTAHARGVTVRALATRAARAGTDLILTTGTEGSSAYLFRTLVERAKRGRIPEAALRASYARILALKERLRAP